MSQEIVPVACVIYGPAVALVVAALKRMGIVGRFIAKSPKLVATVGSGLLAAAHLGAIPQDAAAWQQIALCAALTLSGAIGTHEVALDPLAKLLGLPDIKKAGG